ncbi:hypothetical protein T492DRAFT_947865 [Pavlovales sp. CCMP2436]|nr:hypothetical protein T492DRAFT_947865 [Pavlovales sp. CCMP2436]
MHAMRSVATPPPLEAHALRVKPRTRFVLPVRVDSVEEAEGEDAQYPTLVIKWTRHVAEDGRMVGSYTARRPGVLMLCWDNTYSVFTPKSLSYTVTKETGAL